MCSKLNFEDTHGMLVEGRLFYLSSEIIKVSTLVPQPEQLQEDQRENR